MNDISVSTHTFLVYTNLNNIDLEAMFNEVNINDYLVHILYKNMEKGFKKKRRPPKKQPKNFLNCISFTFIKNTNKINIKLFNTGVTQLTGCKNIEQCKLGIILFWDSIKDIDMFNSFSFLDLFFVSVMRNINFNLGFQISREKLGKYMLEKPEKYKILPIMGGFIGLQFLIELESIDDMPVYKFVLDRDNVITEQQPILYKDFIKKQINKKRINISIFQTGRVLISGIHEMYQAPIIEWILDLVENIKDDIIIKEEEKTVSLEEYLKPPNID